MIRACDGTDPNLTRSLPAGEYSPARHALSTWDKTALPGYRVIRCDCGLSFDYADREVAYPHTPIGGTTTMYYSTSPASQVAATPVTTWNVPASTTFTMPASTTVAQPWASSTWLPPVVQPSLTGWQCAACKTVMAPWIPTHQCATAPATVTTTTSLPGTTAFPSAVTLSKNGHAGAESENT